MFSEAPDLDLSPPATSGSVVNLLTQQQQGKEEEESHPPAVHGSRGRTRKQSIVRSRNRREQPREEAPRAKEEGKKGEAAIRRAARTPSRFPSLGVHL